MEETTPHLPTAHDPHNGDGLATVNASTGRALADILSRAAKDVKLILVEGGSALIRDTQSKAAEQLEAQNDDHESKLNAMMNHYEPKLDASTQKAKVVTGDKKPELEALKAFYGRQSAAMDDISAVCKEQRAELGELAVMIENNSVPYKANEEFVEELQAELDQKDRTIAELQQQLMQAHQSRC
ncbi:hypothetical protein G6011_02863 [Alternaria panax]|uniref:Uncharacterized protein n=1 Tax=Alternaria panax TaxID=48097 RepID=A0AAD4FA61_9PLEO|nr:hypothetical protein G6011_02863 [Alternaria panax]